MVCFGVSWPVAILKTWRAKRVEGKSIWFLVLVFIGYLSGMVAKFIRAATEGKPVELVTLLYAFNAVLVMTDLLLVLKYRAIAKGAAPPA